MYYELSIVLLFLLGLIVVFIEFLRKKEKGRISIFLWIQMNFLLYFIIVPFFYIIFFNELKNMYTYPPVWISRINFSEINFLYPTLLIYIGYFSILFGFFAKNMLSKSKRRITVSNIDSNNHNDTFTYFINERKFTIFHYIVLTVSIIAIIIYIIDLGGIVRAIQLAEVYRMHDKPPLEHPLLKNFNVLVLSCSMFFFVKLYKNSKGYLIFFTSLLFSILYLVLNAGRADMFYYLAFFVLFIFEVKKSFKLRKLILIVVIGLTFAFLGDRLISIVQTDEEIETKVEQNVGLKLIEQLSPTTGNLLTVHSFSYEQSEFLYLRDLFTLIPGRIYDLFNTEKPIQTWKVNTNNFSTPEGTGITVDIISYGYYQFSIPGVIFFCFLYGLIIRMCEDFFSYKDSKYMIYLKILSIFFLTTFLTWFGIDDVIIASRWKYWLFILVGVFLCKKMILDRRYNEKSRNISTFSY